MKEPNKTIFENHAEYPVYQFVARVSYEVIIQTQHYPHREKTDPPNVENMNSLIECGSRCYEEWNEMIGEDISARRESMPGTCCCCYQEIEVIRAATDDDLGSNRPRVW